MSKGNDKKAKPRKTSRTSGLVDKAAQGTNKPAIAPFKEARRYQIGRNGG